MSYDVLEQKARAAKIGLWSDPNPTAPWDWRKSKRK
jgi:micrococcal nuclease